MSGRIDDLLARMTLAEKIGQLNLVTPGGDTLTGSVANADVAGKVRAGAIGSIFGVKSREAMRAFQDLAMETRLKIPLMFAEDVIHGYRTIFPIPLALAASFDMDLVARAARVSAVEASGMGIDQAYAPMIDVCRDPRWGRIAESPGEDPHLAARFSEALVRGFQGDDLACPESVMACLKHFVGYGAATGGRDYDRADMSPTELHDVYLPPFQAGVAAGAGSIMAAFHALNGVPMHTHAGLLRGVLRHAWGFDGPVVADYTGVMELTYHGIAGDLAAAAVKGLVGGVDMDMVSEAYVRHLADAVAEGRLDPALVDEACRRVLAAKERLGLLDDPYLRIGAAGRPPVALLSAAHRQAAREAVADSCVLLKNEDGLLPLAQGCNVALSGPLADDSVNMNGTWAVCGDWRDAVPLTAGLGNRCRFTLARGANITDEAWLAARLNVHDSGPALSATIDGRSPEQLIAEAVAQARDADVALAVVGEAREYAGESSSRTDLRLAPGQVALLKALKATGKPVVAVVMTGRPLVLTDIVDHCDAILIAWFGGTESGHGIADVLFGAAEPGGRLPATFPWHEGQIPVFHARLPTGRPFPGRFQKFRSGYVDVPEGIRHDDGLYPFGFGLSYTQFAFGAPQPEKTQLSGIGDRLRVTVPVTNTGARTGSAVVQLYIGDPLASRSRPLRELKGFAKLTLAPGEHADATFELTSDDLSFSVAESVGDVRRAFEPGRFIVGAGPDPWNLSETAIDWLA
ncbi:beta-glucosidase BglX [Methylobrevis pamukkalensis]|uniref:beta-glucosidase n=1 Tax=Methylobrevis pamukkalensis TaxID=1439726 RepID=A0A1E3H1U3_9HYPH|nr:beta-glucosidase BglX [Methylobrevis pamukkalensis]ODN70264.1 Periplasmic beta-glucosidase precursor [Methylobrevis pamukkalensis]